MIFIICIALLLFYTPSSSADTVTPRAFLGCALVQEQIHCYGGLTGMYDQGTYNNPVGDHIVLDLQKLNFNNVSTAQTSWYTNTKATGANLLVANGYQLVSSLSSGAKFVVYGGYGPGSGADALANPFLQFDLPTNTWSSLPTYGNYTVIGAIVDNGSNQSLWTWGGNVNNTGLHSDNQAYIFNYGTSQWNQATGDLGNTDIRFSYTATLGNNNRIYIIGGFEAASGINTQNGPVDMLKVRWFDTTTSTWGTDNATVAGIQQSVMPRAYHSATLLPGSTKILVYGGSTYIGSQNTIPADYAYLYDYENKQYSLLDLGSNGAGRRSAHCAVLYKNYIFFMFGFNEKLQLQGDINVLDVSNVTQPVWVTAASSPAPSNNGTTPIPSSDNHNASGLSIGATAGIAVAAVIVGLGVAIAGGFLWYRRRKQNRERELNRLDPRAMLDDFHTPIYPQKPTAGDASDADLSSTHDNRIHSTDTSTPYHLKEVIKPSSNELDPGIKPFAKE